MSTAFRSRWLPYALLAPQVAVTLVFFIWPASQAAYQSFFREDAFGLKQRFVWLENYQVLFSDPAYWHALKVSFVFAIAVALVSLSASLLLAMAASQVTRGRRTYRALLVTPYAVAPAIVGVVWLFLFAPVVGILPYALQTAVGYHWDHRIDGNQAMLLVVLGASWKLISYNFVFFLAGLLAIPRSVIEAADIDGAGPIRRFWSIIFPLLSPTTFFLLVVDGIYAFFDTFGLIHTMTGGGPGSPGATNILVYKVYHDGFLALDLGSSSAQSVVLMVIVILLTVVQFRVIGRRVHYA
ncbi:MAG TPA: sn-glycerol-3-phosphate ABC transporter permease UgpA [Reyranella sp.]|nr:sn-glycerol-3-phosphate ABC transporter permease UgpA [Reyranella sp.]